MRKSFRIILIAVSLVVGISLLVNGLIGLQNVNREIDEAKPVFIAGVLKQLEYCTTSHPDAVDPETLIEVCKEGLKTQLEYCDFYGNPDVCKDPRINQVMKGDIPK